LTATLAQSTFNAGFYLKSMSDNIISDASFSISRLVNGSFIVVGTDTTDVTGFVTFQVRDGVEYRFTISASSYSPRSFDMKIYSSNSPYTFRLTPTESTQFENVFDYIDYTVLPVNSTLMNNRVYTFSLQTISVNGSLLYQYTNCSKLFNDVSGSPSGATTFVTFNVSVNSSILCYYFFSFETPYSVIVNKSWSRYYFVTPVNRTLVSSAQDVKDDVDNPAYLAILAYFLIFVVVGVAFAWSGGNSLVAGFVMIVGVVACIAIGWIDPLIGGLVAFIGALGLFIGGRN
jgi:hypothetical protein